MRDLQSLAVDHSDPPFGEWADDHSAQRIIRRPLFTATFRTRQLDDHSQIVRTVGVVCHFGNVPPFVAAAPVVIPGHSHYTSTNCAHGKVALAMRQQGDIHVACYQVCDCRTQVVLAACGNTIGAVAALDSRLSGTRHVNLRAELANQDRIQVEAELSRLGPSATQVVRQTWHDVPLQMCDEQLVSGRNCTTWLGPLNNYLVVRARPDDDPAELTVKEAVALWRYFGLDRQPLLARMAVVQLNARPLPSVKFFTCGQREHPSAPLTGLAILALAAQRLEWRDLTTAGRVMTPNGPMALPRVHPVGETRVRIEFPPVIVELGC